MEQLLNWTINNSKLAAVRAATLSFATIFTTPFDKSRILLESSH